jgi:hypothetical protein
MAGTRRRWLRGPVASRPDTDLIRMTPMVAAAGYAGLFFAAAEIEPPERAQWRNLPTGRAKQHDAAMNMKKPQLPR